jgi:uncharacterized protein YhaN
VRIDRIDLIRFGHFVDRRIEFQPTAPDFFIVYGDNEAGKSTLLRAISAMFFGVPARTIDVHSCKPQELRVGGAISSGSSHMEFRRRKGTSGTLLNSNEGQMPDGSLAAYLRELDKERFEQFFGLNHERLREGGEELLHGKGEIGSALFQAAGLLDLRRLLDALDSQAKDLFSPKSRTKAINAAVEEFNLAKSETRRLAISASAIKEKQGELGEANEKQEKLKAESEALVQELIRLRRIATNKPDIARLQDLRSALAKLESIPSLPVGTRTKRDKSAAELADAKNQIQALKEQIAQRRRGIDELKINEELKAHASEIGALQGETNDYHRGVNDRPKRASEMSDAIQKAEAEWKEIWHRIPITEAENLRAVYARRTEIINLITEHARLTTALTQAEEQLTDTNDESSRLSGELDLRPDPGDPATLSAAIEEAKSLGDSDRAIARFKSDVERLTADCNRDLKRLRGWPRSLQELEDLETPLLRTIDRYVEEWGTNARLQKEHATRVSGVAESIRVSQSEIERLAKQVAGAGEAELFEARGQRDRLWGLIRASAFENVLSKDDAQNQSGDASPIEANLTKQIHRADELADRRFANAKDAASQDRLRREIEIARAEQSLLHEEAARLQQQHRDLSGNWAREWSGLGAEPLPPAEMKEWLHTRQAILDRFAQSRQKEEELHLLVNAATKAGDRIAACLTQFAGERIQRTDSLNLFIKAAEGFARQVEDRRREIADIRRRLREASPDKLQAKVSEFKKLLGDWTERWSATCASLLLPSDTTPETVSAALATLESVYGHLRDAKSLQHRVDRIGQNIDLFEKRVSILVAATDSSLASSPAGTAVTQLHQRLVESGKAETQRDAWEDQNNKDEQAIAGLHAKAQRAETSLQELRELAQCEATQDLEMIISASEQKVEKLEEYERIAQSLIERNAADLSQIEEEAGAHALDTLRSEIDKRDTRQKELQNDLFKAGQDYGTLRQEFERLQASDESTAQAQKAEDALARIRPAVANYLRLQLASEVLRRAIERYREKHQGPVLNRASELFASLTLGDYRGLTTGFGESDKSVLVAVRRNRENVEVAGLSDGTRDQLYLALRLAAIEQHVERVSPCPVIFDDVLINADNARASATLNILASLATRTQVLFFTHHRHLADLGCEAGAQIVDLGQTVGAISSGQLTF